MIQRGLRLPEVPTPLPYQLWALQWCSQYILIAFLFKPLTVANLSNHIPLIQNSALSVDAILSNSNTIENIKNKA